MSNDPERTANAAALARLNEALCDEHIATLQKENSELLAALEQFCYYVSKGPGTLGKNPYCVAEFKVAMVAIAKARGRATDRGAWMDALEGLKVAE